MKRRIKAEEPFWRHKRLDQLSREEWESLCDGCGQCCRMKLAEEETGDLLFTELACRLLDVNTCRCRDYHRRLEEVPACLNLTPDKVLEVQWLPRTCAYRMVAEGKDLEWWHPLVSGDSESVHAAGVSVRGEVISEAEIEDIQEFLARWYDVELSEDELSEDELAEEAKAAEN